MSTRDLLALLADGEAHPGVELAASLGVSRAAVWKQVETLRRQGLSIQAQAGKGYALPWPLELLDGALVRAALPVAVARRVGTLEVSWEVDSTNSELRRRNVVDRSFLMAEYQGAGRGRRGRGWLSPPGLGICLSMLKRFDDGVPALAGLSLAVGVMLMRALEDAGITGAGLKWPNDVLADGAKLAGILVEVEGEYAGPCRAVIGIGVNLRLPASVRAAAGQPASDLATLAGGVPPSRNAFAAQLVRQLVLGLDAFAVAGFAAFAEDFDRHDLLRDRALRVETPRGILLGVGAGVDARGALKLSTARGMEVLDSAEVSVRRT